MLRAQPHIIDLFDQVSQVLAACDEINIGSIYHQ
jgi:hypothetical protein